MKNGVNRALVAKKPIITFALSAVLAFSFASCGESQEAKKTERSFVQKVYDIPEYTPIDWDTHEIENIQSIQDQWMHVPEELMQDSLIVRLVDAYNACVVWHSVGSDMEVFWRWEIFTDTAMLSLNLSNIGDKQTRRRAKKLIERTAAGQRDTTINVQQIMDQYLDWVSKNYYVKNFCDVDFTGEDFMHAMDPAQWIDNYAAMKAKRALSDTIFQQQLVVLLDTTSDFNVFCVLAIEYANSSTEGPWATDALPYLEKALTSGIYSPLLRDVWRTWRASLSTQMGASKDSDIPNAEYNQLRMLCCYTMLCYIHERPTDWLAINNYLVTAYWDNICRYGVYPFGNQSWIDQLEMFPEWADKILSE